ncbi:Oidioi.mRNA.OKI2018_I69.chr1.g3001.t1.cds [Oikopleura dioica]|uniref:Oidioi.mRNA.OKI2018_I69.chr1.g3001.t1.cds n=1 Tax=Oikopleura dioica TaxID=34765 RepID=A0ABN7SST6_OIKDI|nr:Oidioi.mRNA.OKI2018_I69.chr1.g3001.t1.cds [Oikopleura dioica]
MVQVVFQLMGQVAGCVDPIIYCFLSNEFRTDLFHILSCRFQEATSLGKTMKYINSEPSASSPFHSKKPPKTICKA